MNSLECVERIERIGLAGKVCSFGISYLDDALGGIRPTDLVIVAGKTGAGKTQLGTAIALHNMLCGKKVLFMGLEAEQFEIERRIKFQIIAQEFFKNREKYPESLKLTFTDWLFNKYFGIPEIEALEDYAEEAISVITKRLTVYTPTQAEFSKDDFSLIYEEFANIGTDLIILDHIHYLASDEKELEHEHIKKTMWRIRNSINAKQVPIIAISHLRKENRKEDSVVPSIEELHGSSEIPKQANHVIAFAPAYTLPRKNNPQEEFAPPAGSTLCKILKTRTGNARSERYIGLLTYNQNQQTYEKDYVPYGINRFCTKLTPLKYTEFEFWMGLGREARS